MKPSLTLIIDRNRDRGGIIADLHRLLPEKEKGKAPIAPLGLPVIDAHLPQGGLDLGALHEIVPTSKGDMPAAFGFVAALLSRTPPSRPVLFITSPRGMAGYGRIHGHGLNGLGLNPARVILVEAGDEIEALWAMEEALRSAVPAAVAGVSGTGLDLKSSKRLHLAAEHAGLPLLLLRPGEAKIASAAATRWHVSSAGATRDRFGLITQWRWRVRLDRCRNGRPGEWLVEWNHVAYRFSLVATMADFALPFGAGTQPLAAAG